MTLLGPLMSFKLHQVVGRPLDEPLFPSIQSVYESDLDDHHNHHHCRRGGGNGCGNV